MRSRFLAILVGVTVLALGESQKALARGGGGGGGRGGGGGGSRGSSGSFSRPSSGASYSRPSSGGSGSYSRPSGGGGGNFSQPSGLGGGNYSKPSAGDFSRPSTLPSNLGGGRLPATPSQRPSGGDRSSLAGSATQLPSYAGGVANRPAQQPARPGGNNPAGPGAQPARPGMSTGPQPGTLPAQRPSRSDVGNFLGIAGGAVAGGAVGSGMANHPSQLPANRPSQLPANRPNQLPANRPEVGTRPVQRPEQRPNWADRSHNRDQQWQQRVSDRNDAWNNWQQNNQSRLDNFHANQDQRWNNLQNAQEDRQNWRDQNREDWQEHREEMWDYRADRANEIWDNARDYHDDLFDDHWWGGCGWGFGTVSIGYYPSNPWWWWAPATFTAVAAFIDALTPDPVYIDYGVNVIYEGSTVYVNNQPIPAEEYSLPVMSAAANITQPPAPAPASPGQQEQWLPLGVFALAQEEKGEPTLFMQLSVNRMGVISGAYKSLTSNDQRPIAGQVDKATQQVSWRIGENTDTIFVSSLANLTLDVSPIAIHFGKTRTQTWLLVRMPEPAPAGQPSQLPEIDHKPPPLSVGQAPAKK